MLALYAASGLRAACWVGPLAYLGAFLTDDRGLDSDGVAIAYATAGVGVLLGNLAADRLGRIRLRPLVAGTTAAQGLFFAAVFALPLDTTTTIAALAPTGFVGAVAFVAVTTLLVEETPAGPATTMVLNGSVFNLGTATGGAAGGVLIALGGYPTLGLALPVVAGAAAALAWAPSRSSGDEPTT